MGANRVQTEYLDAIRDFADQYWDNTLKEAYTAFAQPSPRPDDRDYWKKLQFQHNAKKALLVTLKLMAQAKSGAVHPIGQNTATERAAAADWISKAREQLGADPAQIGGTDE